MKRNKQEMNYLKLASALECRQGKVSKNKGHMQKSCRKLFPYNIKIHILKIFLNKCAYIGTEKLHV